MLVDSRASKKTLVEENISTAVVVVQAGFNAPVVLHLTRYLLFSQNQIYRECLPAGVCVRVYLGARMFWPNKDPSAG